MIWTEEERGVFRYFDGKKMRAGDPMAIYARLSIALNGEIKKAVDDSNQGRANAKEEYKSEEEYNMALLQEEATVSLRHEADLKIWAASRIAFEMVPFNEDAETAADLGATTQHCEKAFNDFADYMSKKNVSGAV
jgi:hypothetical protein